MATKFVYSAAVGLNDGTSWANAWTSSASSNGVAAGDFVKHEYRHNESGLVASINWANGTLANPVRLISCDKDNSDALRVGATIAFNVSGGGPQGNIYDYGVTFSQANANLVPTTGTNGIQIYDNATLKVTSTGNIVPGGTRGMIIFNNTNIDFSGGGGAANSFTIPGIAFRWNGGTYTCRGTQTNLYGLATGPMDAKIRGVNHSGTVTNLFSSNANSGSNGLSFEGCTAPTFTNVFSTAPTSLIARVNLNGLLAGTLTTALLPPTNQADVTGTVKSKTSVYRTGGADDGSQANAHSWEMAGSASVGAFTTPLEAPPITRWVSAGNSQTVTVYVASGGTLNDDEFWIEVLSPSEAGSATAQSKYQSTRCAPLASPAACTTDGTSTWNGSGVGTKQKCSVTISPTIAGPVVVRVYLAKNVTAYVDPVIDVAGDVSGKSRMMEGVQTFAATSAGTAGMLYHTGGG